MPQKGQTAKHEWVPDIFPGDHCTICGTIKTILLFGKVIYRQPGKYSTKEEPPCITRTLKTEDHEKTT